MFFNCRNIETVLLPNIYEIKRSNIYNSNITQLDFPTLVFIHWGHSFHNNSNCNYIDFRSIDQTSWLSLTNTENLFITYDDNGTGYFSIFRNFRWR